MNVVFQFVVAHGYSILFAAVFTRQIGLPVPANLFLIAAGALAAAGKLELAAALGLAVTACVLADWAWYEAGRRRGDKVLHFIHRLSRDPEFHNRRAKETFARYGLLLLVLAKFVPGLDAIAPPLAGTSRTSRLGFLAFEILGASLWSCAYAGLGYVFSNDLTRAAIYAARAGTVLAGVALSVICVYALGKMVRSRRLRRKSDMARITLHGQIEIGNSLIEGSERVR